MDGDRDATVHSVWQMGLMDAWSKDESQLAWWSTNKDTNLFLQFLPFGEEVKMECFEGSREPRRGWVSTLDNWPGLTPAPLVQFSYPCSDDPSASAVLLVPFAGAHKPAYAVRRAVGNSGYGRHELELGRPDGGTDLIAWSSCLSGPLERLSSSLVSDGPFVWLRLDASGKAVKGFVLDGSFVTYRGREISRAPKRKAMLFDLH